MAEQTYNQRYADGDDNTAGAFGFDQVSSVDYAISKVAFGDANTITRVTASAGLPVTILAGSASIGVLGANSGVDIGDVTINNASGASAVHIQDGGNSITIDGSLTNLAQLGGAAISMGTGVRDSGTQRVTVATDDLVPVSLFAGGAAATVDAAGSQLRVGGPQQHDAPFATEYLQTVSGYASSSAPTNVSANGDAVRAWYLLNGQAVTQPAYSGVLAVAGNGASGTGVQRVTLANDSTGVIATVGAVTAITNALPAGTNYIGKFRPTDGTTDAEVVPLTGYNAQAVAIVDGSGDQITSFGGGTQYTEGDTDASITGTAMLWEDAGNALATVSAGSPLPVAIISGAGSGGTASDDDADFTAGTTAGTPAMGVYESSPTSVTDGDLGVVGITATRQLKTSAAQSGTWNITDISGTVSLPTGASTAAKQPALGTAGTASSDVITVQGITSMTPLIVDLGANNDVTVTGTVTANAGTNLNTSLLALESGGNLASIASSLSGLTKGVGSSDTGTLRVTVADNSTGVLASIGSISTSVTPGTGATNLGKAEDAAHSSGDVGVAAMTVRQDTAAALSGTDGDYQPLITNASGHLHVVLPTTQTITTVGGVTTLIGGSLAHDAADIGINPHKIGGYASASAPTDVSANGDIVNAWFVRNGAQAIQPTYAGVLATTGNGASGTGVQRVTIANDSTGILAAVTNVATIGTSVTPGTSAAHLGKAEDAAHSSGDVGVMALAVRASSPTERSAGPTDGDYVPFGVNEVGAQWATLTPSANGGCTIFRSIDLDESEEEIKATAGVLYGYHFSNLNASARYLKFYNAAAASVTVGTTTPVMTIPIAGNTSGHVAFPYGIAFSTAICAAATTGIADNDTGAPGANEVTLNAWYK